MVCVDWSLSDRDHYLVYADNEDEAVRKVKSRWPGGKISGTYKLQSEIIR